MAKADLSALTAVDAAARIAEGAISAEEYAAACIARVDAAEETVRAFAYFDRDHVLQQARERDEDRRAGKPCGPLHGIPVALKDIVDTKDLPTECGSPILSGRLPWDDAAIVTMLKAAGAIIFGKTVTTEFAYFHPGPTRNPHDPERTPGGSSSGSAAAVAAQMVPLAVGTQTNGSVIRPASFCGLVGFKPSHGLIPRTGVLRLSRTLDQIGVFARTIEDAALLAENIAGYHEGDPDTRPRAKPPLLETAAGDWPIPPRLAFVRSPVWDQADASTREAFNELSEALGDSAVEVELTGEFAEVHGWHKLIMESEMSHNLLSVYRKAPDKLSPILRELLERGRTHMAADYLGAAAGIAARNEGLEAVFDDFNAIVTPATPGEAPKGLDSTGNPAFNTIWTFLGVPAITLPLMQTESGMPLGVQLVGRKGDDARLLRTARWLVETLTGKGKRRRRNGASGSGRSRR